MFCPATVPFANLEALVPKEGVLLPGATVGPTGLRGMVVTRTLCTSCAQECAGEESPYSE